MPELESEESGSDVSEPAVAESEGVGLDSEDSVAVGFSIEGSLLLPGEDSRPLPLQPTSKRDRTTAPNAALEREPGVDRLVWGTRVFVIMLPTIVNSNLGAHTPYSRSHLISP